jgi:hypothetical protein
MCNNYEQNVSWSQYRAAMRRGCEEEPTLI